MYEGANDSVKGRVVSLTFADEELVSHLFIFKCIFFISMPLQASLFRLPVWPKCILCCDCPSRNRTV